MNIRLKYIKLFEEFDKQEFNKQEFEINEWVTNPKNTSFILNSIEKFISKKYNIISTYIIPSYINIEFINSEEKERFLEDEKIQKSILDKFENENSTLLLFSKMGNKIQYYIKNLLLKRVKPPKFVYHVAEKDNKKSILKNGLIPKMNDEDYGDCNYNKPFIFATIDKNRLVIYGDIYDVWIIDTSLITNKWFIDFNYANSSNINHIITENSIPPIALKCVDYNKFIKMKNLNENLNESYENKFYLYNDIPVYVYDIDYDLGDEIRVFYTKEDGSNDIYTSDIRDFENDFIQCSEDLFNYTNITDFKNDNIIKNNILPNDKVNIVYYIGNRKIETIKNNVDKKTAYSIKNHLLKGDKYIKGIIKIEKNI